MPSTRRRWIIAAAAIVSAPATLLSAVAAVYILYSFAAEHWYRQVFLAYGLRRVVLDVLLVAGVAAAAMLATRDVGPGTPRQRAVALSLAVAGALAALVIEYDFWDEADRLFPRGAFVAPFIAWAVAGAALRARAPAVPPQ